MLRKMWVMHSTIGRGGSVITALLAYLNALTYTAKLWGRKTE
jgi:hypothetical protein